MSQNTSNTIRVVAGVLGLFVGYIIGGYLGGNIFPLADLVNKMETLPTKLGSSLGILVVSILLRRFVIHTWRLILTCLVATEFVVFLIIIQITGLLPFSIFDLLFNAEWLYVLTWNVIIACLIGSVVGGLWNRKKLTISAPSDR